MSTALMYSFAQRSDTRVLDEPLYGHFLRRSGAERPDRQATLAVWPSTAERALEAMRPTQQEISGNRHLFCKHIANHLDGLPWDAFEGGKHVLLFRDPAAVMASYGVHIERPMMRDLCYSHQLALLKRLEAAGETPIVVCSDRLQSSPEPTLRALCSALDLEWNPAVLQWEAGPRPEDGPWAPWWYGGVHRSTGWEARATAEHSVPPELDDLYRGCLEAYTQLLQYAL